MPRSPVVSSQKQHVVHEMMHKKGKPKTAFVSAARKSKKTQKRR